MAQIYPSYALDPRSVPAQQQYGLARETRTLQWLRASLPDGYTIYHSTHIAWMDDARLKNREADFLIVNAAGQILMVEQKTGALEETTNGLYKSYGGVAKSVVTQCHEAVEGLRASFRTANGPAARLEIRFVLYCPDHAIRDASAAGIAPEQIVDSRRPRALPRVIRDLLPERTGDPDHAAGVRRMLTQTVSFDADLGARAAESEKLVARLTGDLLEFLGGLDMTPYRLRVEGTAGCGKTQMVAHFAERARTAGRRCLVVCFNRLLADELRDALPPEVSVDTLHGVARRLLENADQPPDMTRVNERDFWPRLVSDATDAALSNEAPAWLFDALIVDEGQDMQQNGFELLKLLLKPGADVVWLQDEGQRLYGGRAFAEPGFVGYRCRDNYRSPRRIGRFIKALLDLDFEVRNPLPGDSVQVIEATPEALLTRLGERVAKLVSDGHALDQIVILTGRGMQASQVMRAETIGGHAVRRPSGYTPDGETLFTEGALRVETLWRFKGHQTPVVLVCELEGDLSNSFTRSRLYVAASRATAHLEWFVPRTSGLAQALRQAASRATDER